MREGEDPVWALGILASGLSSGGRGGIMQWTGEAQTDPTFASSSPPFLGHYFTPPTLPTHQDVSFAQVHSFPLREVLT